jgi:tetratricopeptide (TPR) repeat protein
LSVSKAGNTANPFIVGGSDPQGLGFFGREDVFEFVCNALGAVQRSPVVLYGHRRIGKSAVLRQLVRRLQPDIVCVYYDLQSKAREPLDVVLYGLGRAICEALGVDLPEREHTTEETFRRVFLSRIAKTVGSLRGLVFLLDEFDVIDELRAGPEVAARKFVPYLADLLAVEPEVGLVMVVGRRTEELSETFRAALLKDSLQIQIARLTHSQVDQMLRKLPAPTLVFDPTAVARVYFLAAGHPYCTQAICSAVWSRAAGRKAEVDAADVDLAIDDAVMLGTNGMSWTYDGLELPEQRVFVSALSEVADPVSVTSVNIASVQSFLRDRHLSLNQSDLSSAARDLLAWDVLEAGNSGTFHFAVPLLGAWIRRERPLLQLEREIRFANPRAWHFYEAAREAERSGKYDDAIAEYRDALSANPVFLEAQRALAAALRKRGARRDLSDAIEACERVLELDPESPKTDLLDALLNDLESTPDVEIVRTRFNRIKQLDLEDMTYARAKRVVEQRATAQMAIGDETAVKRAVTFYELLEADTELRRAREIRARQERLNNRCFGIGFALLVLSAAWGFVYFFPPMYGIRLLSLAASGIIISWASVYERDTKVTFYNSGVLFFLGAVAVGELIMFLGGPFVWAGSAAWFGSIANSSMAPTIPKGESRSVVRESSTEGESGPLLRLIDFASNGLIQLSNWLKRRPKERERGT